MAEAVRIPQVGEIVAGKYRLKRLLGEGGMGSVLEAEHLKLRQPIAIKFLNPSLLNIEEIVQRFEREARAAATLRSRHVVRVTDVEATPEGVPYMVMELLHGADLESERERRAQLPYSEAVDYVLQACGALAEAHDAGIVHRDLKPGNLFLAREDSDRVIVKVLDFGISKFLHGDDVKLTSAGAIMGTALYMSPEQIRGDGSIDARADIWALGVILYELIGGTAPWTGPATRVAAAIVSASVPDLRASASVPEGLANAIYKMLEKSPAQRFSTISETASAIAPFAPPGSIGCEVADHLARRSQRNLARGAGSASLTPNVNVMPQASLTPPTNTTPMGVVGGAGAGSGAGVANAVPASPSSSSDNLNPSIPAQRSHNPDRSTMAATTTSTNLLPRSQRALWGALAGFCTLAVAGVVLIVFVARSSSSKTNQGGSNASVSGSVSAPGSVTADPAPTATTTPTTTAAENATPPPPAVDSAPTTTTARPNSAAAGIAPPASAKKPPSSGLAVREFPGTPPSATAAKPTPKPSSETTASPPPPINPPFLK